jgi:hypothetical protein
MSSWDYEQIPREPSKRAKSSAAFEARKYHTPQSLEAMIQACKPVPNTDPNKSFLPVFFGHAKLYVFAEMYNVVPLKLLALDKLHQTFLTFKFYA